MRRNSGISRFLVSLVLMIGVLVAPGQALGNL